MKLSFKILLPMILISALLILLVGCTPTAPSPGATTTTGGTITGIFETPEACCIANRDHTEGWVPLVNATVSVIDSKDVTHTTKTDSDGKYWLTDVAPGIYYVITACCECEDGEGVYKDVLEEALEEGETYDAGIADCESSALGLIIDYLLSGDVFEAEDCNCYCNCFDEESQIYASLVTTGVKLRAAAINLQNIPSKPLDAVRANADFQGFVVELCDLLEACCVEPAATPPPPPPPPPCLGHTAPYNIVLDTLEATAGQQYSGTVSADDDDGDTLTFSWTTGFVPPAGMTLDQVTGDITWTPGCDDACDCEQTAQVDVVTFATVVDLEPCSPIKVTVSDDCDSADAEFCIEVNPCEYLLTVLVNPSGKGTPSGAGTYPQNSTASISVSGLETGYVFVDWTGDTVADPNSASTTILMDADKTVTANLRWHEVYEPFCRFAFEDLPITPYDANDWDYNDWVGNVDIDCQYYGADLLEKITFTVTHENDGAGRNAEVWFKIPADTFSSLGNYVLNGGSSTAFDDTSDNDFQFISSVEALTVGDEFTLEIVFDTPFSFTCSPFAVSDIFGKGIFFQPYLHVLATSAYDVPNYGANDADPRRLAVPGSWTRPGENIAIWSVYANVNGSSTAGPDFSLEDGTWTP